LTVALHNDSEGLDLVVVPGVAFDRDLNRIGHGKGYYDNFFQRCFEHAKQKERPPPTLGIFMTKTVLIIVAVALKTQLIERGRIPMTDTDWKMDLLVVDGKVLTKNDIKE